MRVIGLTGGIATGKSTVAKMLEALGATVIDADQLSREVVAPGSPTLARVVELFGPQCLAEDGTLDRGVLRQVIFADQDRRRQLEALLHPAIRVLAEARLDSARSAGSAVAVYMAPLLIEAGATDRVDEVWVVTLHAEEQLRRLMARDACSREQAQQIVAAQMPLADKQRYGVVVIDNSGSLDTTRQQVEAAWHERIA